MPSEVVVRGGGIAACCCAALLRQAGHRVLVEQQPRGDAPALMLSTQTQILLRDVFQCESLLEGSAPITKRRVLWGGQPVTVPHSGVVISESTLLERLWRLAQADERANSSLDRSWTVCCSRGSLPPGTQHEFGKRVASTSVVSFNSAADLDICSIEALENGWLFLIPTYAGTGSLISIGADAGELLHTSIVVAPQIGEMETASGHFAASPRLYMPFCGPNWMGCGSAVASFDPIAGEGAGHALRQGILAAAVIRHRDSGSTQSELLQHYTKRVLGGFFRHLQESARFYRSMNGDWWNIQSNKLQEGMDWVKRELSFHSVDDGFRLTGFDLECLPKAR